MPNEVPGTLDEVLEAVVTGVMALEEANAVLRFVVKGNKHLERPMVTLCATRREMLWCTGVSDHVDPVALLEER